MSSPLCISRPVHEAMLNHALRTPDIEVCGLLAGDARGMAVACYPVENMAPDPRRRFEMAPRSQIAAMRSMRERGQHLLAIYHSHPDSTPRPSARDVDEAQYPETWYLIVVVEPAPAVHAFRWSGDCFVPADYTVREADENRSPG